MPVLAGVVGGKEPLDDEWAVGEVVPIGVAPGVGARVAGGEVKSAVGGIAVVGVDCAVAFDVAIGVVVGAAAVGGEVAPGDAPQAATKTATTIALRLRNTRCMMRRC